MIELLTIPIIGGLVILYFYGISPILKNRNNEDVCKKHYEEK